MVITTDVFAKIGICLLGLCGFLVARHIYKHKNNNKNPLVCPIKFDCATVVHSDYSKIFGIPLEILGMVYYSFIFLVYFILLAFSFVAPSLVIGALVGISFFAFVFSLYLIGVQVFALKKGCSWCIVSAVISVLIFILTLLSYNSTSAPLVI